MDSDLVFEAAATRQMCGRLVFGVQISAASYAHHMLGKAERPLRTIRNNAPTMMPIIFAPNSTWSCTLNKVVYLRNRTFSRAVGPSGGVPLTLLT
jgi:hypothetical protein